MWTLKQKTWVGCLYQVPQMKACLFDAQVDHLKTSGIAPRVDETTQIHHLNCTNFRILKERKFVSPSYVKIIDICRRLPI